MFFLRLWNLLPYRFSTNQEKLSEIFILPPLKMFSESEQQHLGDPGLLAQILCFSIAGAVVVRERH